MRPAVALPMVLLLGLLACTEDNRVAGNHTSTGNSQAAGRIVSPDGSSARDVWVECIPDSVRPWDGRRSGWSVRTDSMGRFLCSDLPRGRVSIHAYDPATDLGHWREDTLTDIVVERRSDTLAEPGILRVALPPGSTGLLHLSGLSRTYSVRGEEEITIPEVPAWWTGSLLFSHTLDRSEVVESGLRVRAGGIDSAGYTRKSATIRIPLIGGATVALTKLPVLVRLDSTWSGFAASQPDGSDLRMATTSGSSLPLVVAQWDRDGRTGSLWTFFDSLPAPGASVDLVLQWGLPIPAQGSTMPFRATNGFLAAWPLGDSTKSVLDRVGGTPGTPTSIDRVPGPIGPASRFNGTSSRIVFPGTATGSVGLSEGGPYTLSCWVRLRTFTSSRYLVGHGAFGSGIKFQASYGANVNSWFAQEFHTAPAGVRYALGPADTATWTHLAMTVDGDSTILYLDGIRQTSQAGFDNSDSPKSPVDLLIGASLDSTGKASHFFPGDVSEVWLHSTVRSPEWLRLVATNQAPGAQKARVIP